MKYSKYIWLFLAVVTATGIPSNIGHLITSGGSLLMFFAISYQEKADKDWEDRL